jgi:hypothetical protein
MDEWSVQEEVRRNMSLLYRDGDVIELRMPDVPRRGVVFGYFDDFDILARLAAKYNGEADMYHVLNPVIPELLGRAKNKIINTRFTTKDNEIARRRYIFIDCDPVRPGKIPSTKQEHKAALKMSREIKAWLINEQGFPELFRADSGNGAHILIPVDLPNDSETLKLCKNFIAAIKERFESEEVKIDTAVTNAARLIRLWGTLNIKGENTDERPHRYSRLRDFPGSDS